MLLRCLAISCLLSLCITAAYGATKDEWKSRTIYQLLTDRFAKNVDDYSACNDLESYCGGTWQGVINHLDYIQGMGFDAIWISPVIQNLPGGYHGYWGQNLYALNTNFGSEEDLINLIKACHSRGIWVMLDIVANHVGPVGNDYSSIVPFNQPTDYHSSCALTNYTCFGPNVQLCRLAGLPDLNQSNPRVKNLLIEWVQQILSNYSFDGLRLDTVPEIEPGFWRDLQQAAGCYCVGEVWSSLSCSQSYQAQAIDGTLAYPTFETLRDVFQNGHDMGELSAQYWANLNYEDPDALGVFIDNHDNPRFLNAGSSQADIMLYKNAITWTLTAQGIPIIYYGTEQEFNGGNDPNNREPLWTSQYNKNSDMYNFIADVVSVRKSMSVWDSPQVERYKASNFYAYTRGNTLICLTNQPQGEAEETITYHPYSNGQRICNYLASNDCLTVQNNQFTVTLNGLPKIYIPS